MGRFRDSWVRFQVLSTKPSRCSRLPSGSKSSRNWVKVINNTTCYIVLWPTTVSNCKRVNLSILIRLLKNTFWSAFDSVSIAKSCQQICCWKPLDTFLNSFFLIWLNQAPVWLHWSHHVASCTLHWLIFSWLPKCAISRPCCIYGARSSLDVSIGPGW